ncbi:MAG TPA: molybdopterin cofactor-binding domain-containing protein [Candidatus Sulfotelmatobacter sp.]|nr:molybdopterin cofactor-binding domain-containing protein [Candidatus Sulfotelmatobacter sp.]
MAFTTMVGARVTRREDPRLITGRATYVDDVKMVGLLHAAFVRSPYGHAKITGIDKDAALALDGVVAVYTAEDLVKGGITASLPCNNAMPDLKRPPHYALATDEVRFVGEPVAIVIAEDRYVARDAADLVGVGYEELPAVVDAVKAKAGPPYVHADLGTNVAYTLPAVFGDLDAAFANADKIVKGRIVNQRLAAIPMETRATLASWNPGEAQLTIYVSTQIPHLLRTQLAIMLGLGENRIRVIAPEVGGGFGAKLNVYAEDVALAFASRTLERPVKYVETRSENLQAMTHGRDQVDDVEVAVKNDGTVLGLKVEITANLGAYHQLLTPTVPTLTMLMLAGCYKYPAIGCTVHGVFTNTMATDAYRGAGRPEATFLVERALDLVAHDLGLDPVAVRRKNFIQPGDFPYATPTGLTYDTGNYVPALEKALAIVDYDGLRAKQKKLRAEGRYLGIGVSTYVEVCGMGPSKALGGAGWDSATVRVEPTGSVTVLTGVSPHGQGQETTFAQIVADELGVPIDQVTIVHGDTDKVQYGVGTFGSRGTPVGGAALMLAIGDIRAKAIKIAAHQWEANPDDVEYREGKLQIKGDPSKSMKIAEVGFLAFLATNLPDGVEPGLDATRRFEPPNFVFPFGTHVCVVEVDARSGEIAFVKYVAVDDCGKVINPLIVEGQLHGGLAQGIAQALFEEVVYAPDGQLLTGTLLDYAAPRASMLISPDLDSTVTPTTVNPLGIKGIGEAGTIGSTPAVANAVIDAMGAFGVRHLDMPLKPEKLWAAMQTKQNGTVR